MASCASARACYGVPSLSVFHWSSPPTTAPTVLALPSAREGGVARSSQFQAWPGSVLTVEQEPVTVTVDDREDRLAAHRLEDATIVGLAEARVVLLGAHAPARRLDRVEDARDALGERQRGESDHRLGDRLEGARDERRVLREVVREPRARELPRERERREERGQDRRVADTPVEAHPHDGLELLDPARRRTRIERADRLPVLGRTDGAAHAGPGTSLSRLVALDAPPRLDRVAA